MVSQDKPPVIRRVVEFLWFFLLLALICALLKVATPLLDDNSWTEVLFTLPAGGTGVALLHSFLVNQIMKRRQRKP